ncbi:hypothetical protein AN219_09930, partial [Streptomyces nanshensis]
TAVALPLDTSNTAAFPAFADTVRGVLKEHWDREDFDILLNNAGHGVHKPFAETTEEEFDGLMNVHVKGVFFLTKTLLPLLGDGSTLMNVHVKGVFFLTKTLLPLLGDGSTILNISTGLTRFVAAETSAYAAAKGAVEVLTRYLAKELGPRGIAVNVLAPGATATDFGGGAVRDQQETRSALGAVTAMGRVGEADDIGAAAAALLAEGTSWITGQRIEASGGMLL